MVPARAYRSNKLQKYYRMQDMSERVLRLPEYIPAQTYHHTRNAEKESSARVIDVIGRGKELTVCGHIDLLSLLPLHHPMHRKLLKTFRRKPGNYEGRFEEDEESKAHILNYGNGYVAIHFTDDITRPELSEFLISKDWRMLNAHCVTQKDKTLIYEKWTNVLNGPAPSSPYPILSYTP